jgi:hypothetical protein
VKRALAIRESPCGEKRVEGVEIHYNYRQQGEALYLGVVMKVAVIGDSYMSATVLHKGMHFTEILAERLGWELHTVARGGSTNNIIRSQIQYVIEVIKPDFAIVGTTFAERLEIPINDKKYQIHLGLLNFNYDRTQFSKDQSFEQLNIINPSMEFDAINSFLGIDGQPIFDNNLTDEQRHALKLFYIYNFSKDWKIQLDAWMLQSGFHALECAGIKHVVLLQDYLKMPSVYKDLEQFKDKIVDDELCPWSYENGPYPFHTEAQTQVLLADKWEQFLGKR